MATVKFTHLALGQRFLFRDTRYVKISPLLARAEESGHSQMIPRSALVEPLDTSATMDTRDGPAQAALEELHRTALACVEELASTSTSPPQALARARRQLNAAHQQALAKLGLSD